ncbi:MAG: hypothetical protein CM15mP22_4380 [Gammaproteobacteria bacterium]|nr:MAG: hypothetical protein CM15mP22_4380 [Gammaproteobacteria bacterium]
MKYLINLLNYLIHRNQNSVEDDEKFEIVEQLKVKLKPEGYNSILIDGLRIVF